MAKKTTKTGKSSPKAVAGRTSKPAKPAAKSSKATASPKTAPRSKPAKPSKLGADASASPKSNGQARPAVAPRITRPHAPERRPALTEDDLRKVKTGLTKRDLDHYRDLLLAKRQEILGDVDSLETDRNNKNTGGNLSNMPLHMADVGSDNYEQEFTLHLVESERKLLQEINEALIRIKAGTYGVCLETGVPIARPRLDAKPWAKYCIEVAREKERLGQS